MNEQERNLLTETLEVSVQAMFNLHELVVNGDPDSIRHAITGVLLMSRAFDALGPAIIARALDLGVSHLEVTELLGISPEEVVDAMDWDSITPEDFA
jgi:hypothetical protein